MLPNLLCVFRKVRPTLCSLSIIFLLSYPSGHLGAVTVDPQEISIGTLPVGTRIPFSVLLRADAGETLAPNLRWVSSVDMLRWVGFANTGKDRAQEAQFDFEITAKFPGPFNHSVTLVTGLPSSETVEVPVRGVIQAQAHYFYLPDDLDAPNILALAKHLEVSAGTEAITFVPISLATPEAIEQYRRLLTENGLAVDESPKSTLFLAFRAFSSPNGISSALRNAYSGSPFPESELPTKFAAGPDLVPPPLVAQPESSPVGAAETPRFVAQVYLRYSCTPCTDALKAFGESMFAKHGKKLGLIEFSTFDLDNADIVAKIKAALGDRPYPEEPDSLFIATGEMGSNLQLVPGTLKLLEELASAVDKIVTEEPVATVPPPPIRSRPPTLPVLPPDIQAQSVAVAAQEAAPPPPAYVAEAAESTGATAAVAVPPYPAPPSTGSGLTLVTILAVVLGAVILLMLVLVEGRLRRIEEALGLAKRSPNDSGSQEPS